MDSYVQVDRMYLKRYDIESVIITLKLPNLATNKAGQLIDTNKVQLIDV
jgi:hypothetical protein